MHSPPDLAGTHPSYSLLHFGRYAEIPPGSDPPGQAAWAFARYHLAPNRQVAEAAQQTHQAGVALGTFVLLLCHRSGVGVLHDEATADRLNYRLRTHLEQLEKPSTLELYMHSHCLAGDERGIVEHTLAEGLSWKQRERERRLQQRQQAADVGFAQACAELAGDYQRQGNTEQAFQWFRTAAALGLAEGMRGAGFLITNRPFTDEHTANGVEFARQGAEAGDAFAMINLAVFHDRGLGVEQSPAQAQHWMDGAACSGHWAGLLEKGMALLRGAYGYPVNEAEGKRLLQEAVQTGCSDLLWRLARFYGEGFGVKQNLQASIRFAEAAFRQGNREAARGLAGLYHRGHEGVAGNEELATFWTIQSRVDTAFSMGPKLEDSPLLQRCAPSIPLLCKWCKSGRKSAVPDGRSSETTGRRCFGCGCCRLVSRKQSRLHGKTAEPGKGVELPMAQINQLLLALFQAHGVEAILQDEWIIFPGLSLRANASIVKETKHPAWLSIQLDVRLEIAPGRTIVESFAGLGETREKALADALHNFTANSFHVLLAAFFRSGDQQVSQEEWLVSGRMSRVTIGNVGIRGKPPVQGEQLVGWFKHFEDKLKETGLRPGTHWIRLYYGQSEGKALACEVLLDNAVWEEMQSEMAALAWPAGQEFYSVRVFLVLQVEKGGFVSPESAVACLADIVADRHEFTEDEVYTALADAGVPTSLADRAYKFTQVAWGRVFLASLGVRFSPDYVCLNALGEVVESGHLANEPCFSAASQLAPRYAGTPGFRRLALLSADVNAVNNALHRGSKPEDLVTAPAFLFLETPTAGGMENARRVIAQYLAGLPQSG